MDKPKLTLVSHQPAAGAGPASISPGGNQASTSRGGDNKRLRGDNKRLPGRHQRDSRRSPASQPESSGKQAADRPGRESDASGSIDASAVGSSRGGQGPQDGLPCPPVTDLPLWRLDDYLSTCPDNFSWTRSKDAIRRWLDLLFPYYLMKDGFRLSIGRIRKEAVLSKSSHWWLKDGLLVPHGKYNANSRLVKKYVVRQVFFDYLWQQVHDEPLLYLEQQAEWWQKKWDQLVADPSTLTYHEDDDGLPGRRYCFFQLMPNSVKPIVMRGFTEHDLSTAGVTLVVQQAIKDGASPDQFKRCFDYIRSKKERRQWLARLAGITAEEAKDVFTMVSYLSPMDRNHPATGVRQVLTKKQMDALIKDGWMKDFYLEMRLAWQTCLPGDLWKDGYARHRFYTSLERDVLAPIETALQKAGIPYLVQHDGFTSLDGSGFSPDSLAHRVKEATGFDVTFEVKMHGSVLK